MVYGFGDSVEVIILRSEANFDRACDAAYERALHVFGVTDYDGMKSIPGWDRTTDSIVVEFVGYSRRIREHLYRFKATPERNG